VSPQEARRALTVISGYWGTPVLTEEEVVAFTTELTGPARISYVEVVQVVRAEAGRQWRPRPGELVALVQHYRRRRAIDHPRPALESGEGPVCTREQNLAHISEMKGILQTKATPAEGTP
jgi:hypothetical protein